LQERGLVECGGNLGVIALASGVWKTFGVLSFESLLSGENFIFLILICSSLLTIIKLCDFHFYKPPFEKI
jgi:hypothetical protein